MTSNTVCNYLLSYFFITFFLLHNHTIQSADNTTYLTKSEKKNLVLSLVARHSDDLGTLHSSSLVNKCMHITMRALYKTYCNGLKHFIANKEHGINAKMVTYAPNKLHAYYVEEKSTTQELDDLQQVPSYHVVHLSHYGDTCKKMILAELNSASLSEHKLAQRFKPFLINKAVYVYETYTTDKKIAGECIRILPNGDLQRVYLYTLLGPEYIPSGWLAGDLTTLHDTLINTGSATYYSWSMCTQDKQLKKISKALDHSQYSGIVVFDIGLLTCISKEDKRILYYLTPQVRDKLISDDVFGLDFPDLWEDRHALMHMHISWGKQNAAAEYLPTLKRIKYKIPHYGLFAFDAMRERITFTPSAYFFKRTPPKILQAGDRRCRYALEYLKKQPIFVTKDWSEHAKQLTKQLQEFANTRYTFQHDNKDLLACDTVRSSLYAIHLNPDKKPTLHYIPSVIIASCKLTDTGYTYEIQSSDESDSQE